MKCNKLKKNRVLVAKNKHKILVSERTGHMHTLNWLSLNWTTRYFLTRLCRHKTDHDATWLTWGYWESSFAHGALGRFFPAFDLSPSATTSPKYTNTLEMKWKSFLKRKRQGVKPAKTSSSPGEFSITGTSVATVFSACGSEDPSSGSPGSETGPWFSSLAEVDPAAA